MENEKLSQINLSAAKDCSKASLPFTIVFTEHVLKPEDYPTNPDKLMLVLMKTKDEAYLLADLLCDLMSSAMFLYFCERIGEILGDSHSAEEIAAFYSAAQQLRNEVLLGSSDPSNHSQN